MGSGEPNAAARNAQGNPAGRPAMDGANRDSNAMQASRGGHESEAIAQGIPAWR
jgi:hypothetical protein